MPSGKSVIIIGWMQELGGNGGGEQPPLGIWGPNDPRPTHPIYGFDRWTGTFPGGRPPEPPPGIWGPNDPRPTNPIYGFDRWTGMFPGGRPPEPVPPGPGMPGNLPASDPEGSGWVYAFVPGYGWMWAKVPQRPEDPGEPTEPTPTDTK